MSNIEPQALPYDIWVVDVKCNECGAFKVMEENGELRCVHLGICLNALELRNKEQDDGRI